VVAILERECLAAGVKIRLGVEIQRVERADGYVVQAKGIEFRAAALVVATGGLSIPKMGATAFGYELAQQFGLVVVECRPALVPFTLRPEDRERYCDLAGVSAEAVVSVGTRMPRRFARRC